ncbi:AraC family transcriptional regulator [Pseudoalteromonas byunsanensis]|uniref:AraC family transcriptional regulator n=1 Tax=Pseudoalteromonas byunsanensis TaxID=327939 RepID=A0A1S1NAF6_9GAMM|nr:AraC family transcriptional regulator [Pseudoalteromonas byunsanensis]OHU96520.1 AraC family transcriptional regulator [Pseudoalteromonas byunsanensis]
MHSDHIISVGHELFNHIGHEAHGSQTQYILSFIVAGTLTMQHKEPVTLKANMFTLVPAGVPHSLIGGENLEIWWVSFCPTCLGMSEKDPLMTPFRQVRLGAIPALQLSKARVNWTISLLTQLQIMMTLDGADNIEVIKSLLNLLLYEVQKANELGLLSHIRSDKVTAALDYIQLNYIKSISLKDVAQAVHCSPSYLATKVKMETGFSVGQWIIKTRLTQACAKLLHTDKAVNTIVYELGWSDTTHFIRQFKKAYGMTPASWRKTQQDITLKPTV